MPTTAKTKARQAAERKSKGSVRSQEAGRSRADGRTMSAIELLEQDHREVESFFEEYEELNDDDQKAELAAKICLALKVHAQIEEEIFYPEARRATEDDDLLDEAAVEHAGAKNLISEIDAMRVGDHLFDAKIKVLGDQIRHHIKEEEQELFPEAEAAKMDLEGLGKELAARKAELMSQLSREPSNAE
jgi:hemerythrin superfamily protein